MDCNPQANLARHTKVMDWAIKIWVHIKVDQIDSARIIHVLTWFGRVGCELARFLTVLKKNKTKHTHSLTKLSLSSHLSPSHAPLSLSQITTKKERESSSYSPPPPPLLLPLTAAVVAPPLIPLLLPLPLYPFFFFPFGLREPRPALRPFANHAQALSSSPLQLSPVTNVTTGTLAR